MAVSGHGRGRLYRLATWLCRLGDDGEKVVVLDNLTTGFDWAIDHRATFVQGDAADIEFVGKLIHEHKIDAVIHFAGSIIVPESVSDPLKHYRNNTATSRNLIEAAVKGGVKHFIFSSTAAVYGMTGLAPVVEETPLVPMSPYGRSKLGDRVDAAGRRGSSSHHLWRAALLQRCRGGPGPPVGAVEPQCHPSDQGRSLAALGQRPKMDIFGTDFDTPDGTGVRDYIHVTDLIAAHKLLLDHLRAGRDSTTLNCAYGQGYSVREVIAAVKEVSGVDFRVEEGPRRAGDPPSITATGEKVRKVLGWQPKYNDLNTMVTHALNWERYLLTRNR